MAKSMTGFGRGEYRGSTRIIQVDIRSVNHRYCDISVRLPRKYSFAEEYVRDIIKRTVKRGKIDVSVNIENTGGDGIDIQLNCEIAGKYIEKLAALKEMYSLEGMPDLRYIASLPEVLRAVPETDDEDELSGAVCSACEAAAAEFENMRITEGKKLCGDIDSRIKIIARLLSDIEKQSAAVVKNYYGRLKKNLEELLNDSQINEDRILQEAAVYADRADITEEIVRLKSHIEQLADILRDDSQPVGRKLDFLLQEINREVNTIGSKTGELSITKNVIEMKSEIEKIREQVQNIE